VNELPRIDQHQQATSGGMMTVSDRWFASSQIHHGCTKPDGSPCRLIGKHRIDKQLLCPQTGELVNRDVNASRNLRDWPDMPVDAQLGRRPRSSAVPARVPETAAQTVDPITGRGSSRKTTRHRVAVNSEDRTGPAQPAVKEPRKRSV
jgi:putative transposase